MEISKYMSRKTIIYICIVIVILIILRILYSTFFSNTEGFEIVNGPVTDLLSKIKSTDAQDSVDPINTHLEMQIYSWSNQLYNLQNLTQQSKPITFYKPNLTINNVIYAKLGDIVSQNTDYSLPNAEQFTLLVKKNTSDIKPPIRFDLMARIDNEDFDTSYYNFSNYIGASVNFNVITDSLNNCANSINKLNTMIQNNLSMIKKNFTKQVYANSLITVDVTSIPILKLITNNGGIVEEFEDNTIIEGFEAGTTVDTGYTDFIPTPLINTPYKQKNIEFNLSNENADTYNLKIYIGSTLSLPAGSTGFITVSSSIFPNGVSYINFDISSKLDSEQDGNAQNIVNKLQNNPFSKLTTPNIGFKTETQQIFSYVPILEIINYIISLCNDIENIYNNQGQSKSSTKSRDLLSYLNLAPDIATVKSVLNIMIGNSNNINNLTLANIISQLPANLIITTLTSDTTLLQLVLYIMNKMMISYKLTYLTFNPRQIENVSKAYESVLAHQRTFANPPLIADPTYVGCFNDKDNEKEKRALPNRLNNVSSVNECAQQAQNKQYRIFGVQYGGECWAGNDSYNATKYGQGQADCGILGGYWINQIYTVENTPPVKIFIKNVNNDIISNISASTYNIMTNPSFTSTSANSISTLIGNNMKNINNFSKFAENFSNNKIGYFPLQIYNPIAPENYTTLGHVFCNTTKDLKKIIESNNVACVPSHCVKPIRDWTTNDKIYEYTQDGKYFAIYFNPYTGTFISTNKNSQQLPEGKVCKVVACVKKCTAVEELEKADDCARKYYNLNKEATTKTPLTSALASTQEEEYYLDKIQNQSESITRLKQRAQNMQTTIDKATIVNREMNKNNLQDYVDVQKQNIDIIMKRLQADKNKIQTNVNISFESLNSIIDMINNSSSLSSEEKTSLLTQIASVQNLPNSQFLVNMNEILSSCPQYDLSGLVSKQMASDVCYGCDTPM